MASSRSMGNVDPFASHDSITKSEQAEAQWKCEALRASARGCCCQVVDRWSEPACLGGAPLTVMAAYAAPLALLVCWQVSASGLANILQRGCHRSSSPTAL